MFRQRITVKRATWVAASSLTAFGAAGAQTLEEALGNSDLLFNLRVRYEGVEQAGYAEDADPLTARLRIGVETGDWGKTSLLAEIVGVDSLSGDYNSTLNGDTQYPVVADPGGILGINRFAITNKSLENTTLTFGRQRIVLDDSRFVGNVGWRQYEQTYDGIRAVLGDANSVKIDLAYVSQVNRVFGPDSPAGKFHGNIVLANASNSFGFGTLTGFYYGVDLDEAAALSTNTIGVRLTGSKDFDRLKGLYTFSVAQQTDTGDNAADLSEQYFMLEGGLTVGKATVALGREQLGSDGVNRFTTPLATLHAFQGWADEFLVTPADGIDDGYARLAWATGAVGPFTGIGLSAFYHEFDADFGSAHYGDEIDISVNARRKRASYTLKYAKYDADELYADTDKIWLSMDYSF